MAKKYSDAIQIRETKSAYNIQNEEFGEWKNFIPNEQFNDILQRVISSVTNNVQDEHRSFWLEGTYGTGKSHASAVIKHLLCDPVEEIEDYVNIEYKGAKYDILRQSLYDLRATTRLFPITMYGLNSIAHKDDMSVQIQSAVSKALYAAGIDVNVKTDFDNYISHIEKRPTIWDNIIEEDMELQSYAPDRKKLIQELKASNTTLLSLVKNALRNSGITIRLEQENLSKWFFEVQDKLAELGTYKGILLLWDEFTDVMTSDLGPSLLVELQSLAEATMDSKNNSYFFHIAHPSALDSLKAAERTKTTGRYRFMHYNMEPVSAFKIMSRKFVHDDENAEYVSMVSKHFAQIRDVYEKFANTSNSPDETLEDLKNLFPVHPATANLATYYAREAGSSSRSVFEFLGSNPAIREFLDSEEHYKDHDLITADYLWDFVLEEFNSKVTKYGVVTERYNSYKNHVERQGMHYSAVFKGILLLNALNNLANNETVTPSEVNVKNLFVGTSIDQDIDEVLSWIHTQGIVQRSPQGIYEIRFSALDTKEIEQIRTQLLASDFKYTSQIMRYGEVAEKEFEKKFKMVNRPCQYKIYSEDANEYTLLNKIENDCRMAASYELFFALMVARSNTELSTIKEIATKAMTDDRFKNVAFFVFDTQLDQASFDQFIEYQANAICAQKHGFAEQQKSHADNAKTIIQEWIKNIFSGICTVYLQSESSVVNARLLPQTINSSVAPRIFSKGPESLELIRTRAPQPSWSKQHSKSMADIVLSFNTKEDVASRCTGYARQVAFLLQDSVDDNLKFKSDCDVNHPLYLVAHFVKSKVDHSDKQNVFNLAEKLEDLTRPPYGLFPCNASYGMVAFALRPYVDKVFDTNGKPINAQRMLELITDTYKIWETGSKTNLHKVDMKFETKEEGAIAKALINVFQLNNLKGYSDISSLTDARWALRQNYCAEAGYPLWAVKYCKKIDDNYPQIKDKLWTLTDNIIKIYTEVGSKDPHMMVETDHLLTELKYEYSGLVSLESKCLEDGYRRFLLSNENVNLQENDYAAAVDYIKKHMEGAVGLWTETAVTDKLKDWKISTISETQPSPSPVSMVSEPAVPYSAVLDMSTKKGQARNRIHNMTIEQTRALLDKIIEYGYEAILDEILK